MPGTLYLVGTPIGNLEDMSPRAVRILREVALIAAEDTRTSIKLLNHFSIRTPMQSCHEHNEAERAGGLVARLRAGESIALITDAGLPGISDPGEIIVREAIAAGIEIVPVPGPSACLLALAAAGLPTGSFHFFGFLPRQAKERRLALERVAAAADTIVLYEAPHRLQKTLTDLEAVLGGGRRLAVARELTKVHEEIWRGDLAGALAHFGAGEIKGEITLIVAGANRPSSRAIPLEEAILDVRRRQRAGAGLLEAVRAAAKASGIAKNELYQACLAQKADPEP